MTDGVIDLGKDIRWPKYPYPGLRPFRLVDADESLIFRGRNNHRDDVLERLDTSQFVSVVGPSGCGKSSLVKVGVVPVLRAGLLTRAGYDWQTIEMRPGADPLGNMAVAFEELAGSDGTTPAKTRDEIYELLRSKRSALWMLMEMFSGHLQQDMRPGRCRRVLLLIDQFEEVFSGMAKGHDVDQFIGLITQFFRHPHDELFIVLTMRTDFIGQCANFPGLAEVLNKTQYITPVLRGQDLKDAIEQPAVTYGGTVEAELVAAIVCDMGAGANYHADHLPLMQHALLWLWQNACRAAGLPEPPRPDPQAPEAGPVTLTLAEYENHGRLHGILNKHAEQLYLSVATGKDADRKAAIAETMFRRLSERDASHRYKRAPASPGEICELARCSSGNLAAVVEPFADGNASFVERREPTEEGGQLLDLSHESLIRQWDRLRGWADAEAEKLGSFQKIVGDAEAWQRNEQAAAFLKVGGHLKVLREWWKKERPSPAWLSRYNEDGTGGFAGSLPLASEYMRRSIRERNKSMWLRVAGAAAAILLVGVAIWKDVETEAENARVIAAKEAENLRAIASKSEELRIRSVMYLGEEKIAQHRPAQALQIALKALQESTTPEAGSTIEALAHEALERLHEKQVLRTQGQVFSLSYSPDGKWILASASATDRPYIWYLERPIGSLLPTGENTANWRSTWHPRGSRVLLTTQGGGSILLSLRVDDPSNPDLNTAIPLREPGSDSAMIGMGRFSGDGRKVVTGGTSLPLRLWDPDSGMLWARANGGAFARRFWLAVNADGSFAAAPGAAGGIEVFSIRDQAITAHYTVLPPEDALSGQPCSVDVQTTVRAASFHPSKPGVLAIAVGCRVALIDLEARKALAQLAGSETEISSVAFSGDGARIVTGTEDGIVRLYDSASIEAHRTSNEMAIVRPQAILGRHQGTVREIGFSPDGSTVATAGRDWTIRIWNLKPALALNVRFKSREELIRFSQERLPMGIEAISSDRLALCLVGAKECL